MKVEHATISVTLGIEARGIGRAIKQVTLGTEDKRVGHIMLFITTSFMPQLICIT